MEKEEKLKYINQLLLTASRWPCYYRDVVDNFIIEAKFKINRICGENSPYVKEIDVFNNGKHSDSGIITDWQEQLITTLKKIKFEIETEKTTSALIKKTLKIHCNTCNLETNHTVILEKTEREIQPEIVNNVQIDFWEDTTIQIIKCGSCGELSMKKYNTWCDDAPEFPQLNVVILPKRGKPSIKPPKKFQNIPEHVLSLYKEIVDGFVHETNLLCAGGIRAILEAICKDKGIKGGQAKEGYKESLQGKIYGLCENGFITTKHAEILIHHQYLGDKALHELQKPTSDELEIAIDIVAHTLSSIYELQEKGKELLKRKEERTKNGN